MVEIEKSAHEQRVREVKETFDYARDIAMDALETKKLVSMSFTISFDEGYVPRVSHDITEFYG